METTKIISIVIVTYNSSPLIEECLESIYKFNDVGDSLEVIIVDNNSNDINKLERIVATNYPNVKIIYNKANGGYGQGNNLGIKSASGKYILVMNPDARFKEPILANGIKLMHDNNLAMLGMKQWSRPDKKGISFRCDDYVIPALCRNLITKVCNKVDLYIPSIMYIVGACFFLDKKKFSDLGMFDENIFMYNEESDIRNRIISKFGKKSVMFCKNLSFIHLSDNRPFKFSSDKRIIDSFVYYVSKNGFNLIKFLKNKKSERIMLFYRNMIFRRHKDLKEIQESLDYINMLIIKHS